MSHREQLSAIRRGVYRHVAIAAAAVLLTSAASLATHCEQPTHGPATCVNGQAGPFTCRDVDLDYWLDLTDIGGVAGDEANTVWGWVAPGGREFAIVSRKLGTSFIEVTDPQNPVYLGDLPTVVIPDGTSASDVEVYGNYAYIVRPATGHGLQVFDLTQLLSVASPPVVFAAAAHDPNVAKRAGGIAINTDTGFAYVSTGNCAALEMVDLSNPTSPVFVGCAGPLGQRDAQCVVYHGPDTEHVGDEICFKPGGATFSILDVTAKSATAVLAQLEHPHHGNVVSPQGWLTEDQSRFLVVDIHAARRLGTPRILVFDVSNLEFPFLTHVYQSMLTSPDHNIYVEGNFAYEAEFDAGLRIFDIADVQAGELCEVAFFDVCPGENTATQQGAFSVYPFLPSGIVLVGSTEGLAIVRPQLATPTCTGPGPIRIKRASLTPDRHFKFVAKGVFPLPANPADHPTNGGAQLVVTGHSGGTATYPLPASCWKDLGPGDGSAGFKCKDTVCKVSIKPRGIKAVCRPDTGTLAVPQSAISIQLKLGSGTTQYCALCGGQPKGSPDKPFFKRTDCLAPETCP